MTSFPAFYAIIPAHVRYCKDIPSAAKLLYGEITALMHAEGYCWATNSYFAELYGVDDRTIQRWINALKEKNLVSIEIEEKDNKCIRKIFTCRRIKEIIMDGNFVTPPRQKCHP